MKIEQLEQLIMIEKYGSVSKAAKEMYLNHSTLSNNLNSLEKEIGVRLFERTTSGVTPTIEGKKIIQLAYQVIAQCNQILNFKKNEQELYGSITILLAPVYQFLHCDIMLLFHERYPHATLNIQEYIPAEIYKRLSQNEATIGLVATSKQIGEENNSFTKEYVKQREARFYVGRQHPLANRKSLSLKELEKERFVVYSEHNLDTLKKYISNDLNCWIIGNNETVKNLLEHENCIAYLLEQVFSSDLRYIQGTIQQLNVPEIQNFEIKFDCLLYPTKRSLTLLEEGTISLLREILWKYS